MITNNYPNNMNYGAVKDVVPQQLNQKLPQSVQNYDVKERVGENPAVKAANSAKTDPITVGLTGAIWLSLAQFCQFLNNKLDCDWDKSWLGKIGTRADNFAKKHFKNSNEKKIRTGINNFVDRFDILRSLKTPTKPQNSMAISQARGINSFIMSDVKSMLEYHLKNNPEKNGKDLLKLLEGTDFKGKTGQEALSYIGDLFDNCENNKAQIMDLIKKLSNSNVKVTVDNIINTRIGIPFTNIGFNLRIPNIPFLKRKGSFKEMANKLNAIYKNDAALGKEVTNLGKSLPRTALKTLEGTTNGGAGGKIMIIIQAVMFAQAIRKAMDAPEGEKFSTFTENVANDFGYFLSIPLQVQASHLLGGLKYIGINGANNLKDQKAAVNTYRTMVKELNEKVASGTISHIDYLKESKKIKEFLKGDAKFWQKPFKFLGKVFSTGLDAETIMPFVDTADKSFGGAFFNKIKGLANKARGKGFGTALRLAVGLMVVGPFISKGVTKISHLIFGKPSNSILDEDKEDKKASENKNNPLNMTQEEMMQKLAANPELMQKMENDPKFANELLQNPDLFVKYLNGELKVQNTPQDNSLINSKYIKQGQAAQQTQAQNPQQIQPQAQSAPAQANSTQGLNAIDNNSKSQMDLFGLGKKKEEQTTTQEDAKQEEQDPLEPVRTYIPSSECTIKSDSQEQALDPNVNNAILKADKVEKRILEQLNNL